MKNKHYTNVSEIPDSKPLDLIQTTSTSNIEYIECECDLVMSEADFKAVTDFIAELLLRNHLQETQDHTSAA